MGNSASSFLLDSTDSLKSAISAGRPSFGQLSGNTFLTLVKAYSVFLSNVDSIDTSVLNCKRQRKEVASLKFVN